MLILCKLIAWPIFLSSYIIGAVYFLNYNDPELMYLGLVSVFTYLLGVILLIKIEKLSKLSDNVFILTLTFTASILIITFFIRFFYSLYHGFVTNDHLLLGFLFTLIIISGFSFYNYLILLSEIEKRQSYEKYKD